MIDEFWIAYCIASASGFGIECKIRLFLSHSNWSIISPFVSRAVIDTSRFRGVSDFQHIR